MLSCAHGSALVIRTGIIARACAGEWDNELELPPLAGLVPWGPAVPDRAPPLPRPAPPQSAQGLPAGPAPLPGPGAPLPLTLLLGGKLPCGPLCLFAVSDEPSLLTGAVRMYSECVAKVHHWYCKQSV